MEEVRGHPILQQFATAVGNGLAADSKQTVAVPFPIVWEGPTKTPRIVVADTGAVNLERWQVDAIQYATSTSVQYWATLILFPTTDELTIQAKNFRSGHFKMFMQVFCSPQLIKTTWNAENRANFVVLISALAPSVDASVPIPMDAVVETISSELKDCVGMFVPRSLLFLLLLIPVDSYQAMEEVWKRTELHVKRDFVNGLWKKYPGSADITRSESMLVDHFCGMMVFLGGQERHQWCSRNLIPNQFHCNIDENGVTSGSSDQLMFWKWITCPYRPHATEFAANKNMSASSLLQDRNIDHLNRLVGKAIKEYTAMANPTPEEAAYISPVTRVSDRDEMKSELESPRDVAQISRVSVGTVVVAEATPVRLTQGHPPVAAKRSGTKRKTD